MLDSTKANEFVSQCCNEVYGKVKSCLGIASIVSRIVLLLALLYLESSMQYSHYFDFRNYIYFLRTLTARDLV